jgi:polysaccharide biosynthesis/export protein
MVMRAHKRNDLFWKGRCPGPVFLVVIGLLMTALTGCTNPKEEKLNMMMAESHVIRTPASQDVEDFNRQLLAGAEISTDPGDLLLGTGDLLQVEVFEAKELAAKVRVSSRGYITLPLVGPVEVKGLSAREAEVRIEELYREKYIKDPHVNVFVEEHYSQRVTLVGELKNPGTFDYPSKMRLLDVLSLAGGLNEKAGRTAQIRRMGQTSETSNTIIVDLDRMLRRGQSELNVQINGGDIIFVPAAGNYFISGAVLKPGAYPIKDQVFLLEAISTAGGFRAYADPDDVVVIRHTQDGERQVMELDLEDPEVQQMEIRDRDVIIAKSSAWGKFVSGFGINIGVPGVGGFGYKDPEH